MQVLSDTSARDEFLTGSARAFFISAYANYCESGEYHIPDEWPTASNGEDWDKLDLSIPANAYALAGELWSALEYLNKASAYVVFSRAGDDVDHCDLGWCFAMQAMGTGVSWFDNHDTFPLQLPSMEIHYLSFDFDNYQP